MMTFGCLLSLQADVRIALSFTSGSATINQYRFTRPQVVVYDGTTNVTNQFYINYYIQGQESNVKTVDNKSVTESAVTGTQVTVLYGSVNIGSNAGTDVVLVKAIPRNDKYTEVDASFTIVVEKVSPVAHLSQETITAYAGEVIGLPTAVLLNEDGDTITDKYTVGYTWSSGITKCANYKITSVTNMVNIPTTTGSTESITMIYSPTASNATKYEAYTKTFEVNVVARPDGLIPTQMDWPDGQSYTPLTDGNYYLPKPRVRDDLGNDITQLFRYEATPAPYNDNEAIWSNNGFYWTWQSHPNIDKTRGYKITIRQMSWNTYGAAENDGFVTCSDSCYFYPVRRVVKVTLTPATYYSYGDTINFSNWSRPTMTVNYKGNSVDFEGLMGVPTEEFGVTSYGLPSVKGTITYEGVTYNLYSFNDYFNPKLWISYTNYKASAPRLIFRARLYDEHYTTYIAGDYHIDMPSSISTTLQVTPSEVTANVVDNKLKGFTEPAVFIVDQNGLVVTSHFKLAYSIDNPDVATATGISVNAETGAVSYTGTTVNSDMIKVRVKATPLSTDEYKWAAPADGVYQLKLLKADFNYEIITNEGRANTESVYGKLHFLSGSTLASGTVINGIPGLSVQFGRTGGDNWTLSANNSIPCKEGSNKDKTDAPTVFIEGNPVRTITDDNLPEDGTFLILRPYTNGFLTIDAKWKADNLYRLVEEEGEGDTQLYRVATETKGEHRFGYPLIAGNTYYFYNYGSGTTNEPLHLHGINFEPGFIITSKDNYPSHKSTVFVNGYTGSVSTLLTTPISNVVFSIEAVKGTKSGIKLSDYVTVDASSGALTPKQSTAGITDTAKGEAADCVKLMATVTNKDGTAKRLPWLYLFVSAIPSYVVQNGDQPIVGQVVTTTNIHTPITMTFGGWETGKGPYKKNNTLEDLVDAWRTAKTDTVGQNDMTIDGFKFASQGDQNATDEDGNSFNAKKADDTHQPWELPCRGTYLKFEPGDNGTLIIYLLQNGCIDYTGSGSWDDVNNGYKMKYRPLFIVDETGNSVPLDNSWAMDASLLPVASRQASNAGRYTEGLYRAAYNDETVKKLLAAHKKTPVTTIGDKTYENCSFDLSAFASYPEDLDALMTQWQKYDGTAATARQEIVKLTQGYALISKAFVRYTFQVKAGKTYFVFMRGSKLSCCGFSFVPTYYRQTAPKAMELDLHDTDSFDEAFFKQAVDKKNELNTETPITPKAKKIASTQANANTLQSTEELDNINVRLNRSFVKDKWTGVCFPFSISEKQFKKLFGNDALIITYDSVQGDSAFFSQHVYHMIVANYPYYIKPSQDVAADQLIDSVTVEKGYAIKEMSDGANYTSLGVYAPTQAIAGSYVFAGNNIYHLKTARQLPTYRAYIKPLSTTAAKITHFAMKTAGSKGVITDMDEDSPLTGIRDLTIDSEADGDVGFAKGIYNLQGVYLGDEKRLHSQPQGIYIVYGKKIVVD